jgi:hypothetical protein
MKKFDIPLADITPFVSDRLDKKGMVNPVSEKEFRRSTIRKH